jgi:hypothetical protein
METCVGCGAILAPTWKYCIHCGLATSAQEIPGAIRPDAAVTAIRPVPRRALVLGGIGLFLVGLALIIVAIIFVAAAIHQT